MSAAKTFGGRSVLLLEDEPLILMDLRLALEDEGARVLEARDVATALEMLEDAPPAAAILDVTLGADETCRPVAERLAALGVPFILHSGDLDRQGELIASIQADVIPKPTPSHLVAARVLTLLG